MNNPNPFVPKGSLLEQQSVRRSRLKITVGCVLALSVCALVAMLIEGCKREAPSDQTTPPPDLTSQAAPDTNLPPPEIGSNSAPMMATVPSNASPQQLPAIPMPPQQLTPQQQITPEVPAGAAGTYEVVAGDTLGKIAKAHGVTLKALENANPGVDPKKLHVKQKLNIPAPTASATPDNSTSGTAAGMSMGGGAQYVVKSGDTLSKIAKHNGVSLKALRAANPSIATTDHIKVGDKLTIPAKAETATPATATDTSAPPMVTTPPPQPQPMTPAPGTPAPGH
jgi:LysM repeat protein